MYFRSVLHVDMENPNVFLGLDPEAETRICKEAKDIYDYSLRVIGSHNVGCLGELLIEGFDNEQIWQQVELYNDCILGHHERQLVYFTQGPANSLKKHVSKRTKTSAREKKVKICSPQAFDEFDNEEQPIKELEHELNDYDEQPDEEELSEEEKELEELLKKVSGSVKKDVGADSDSDAENDLGDSEDDEDDGVDDSSSQEDDDDDLKTRDSSVKSLKKKLTIMASKKNAAQKKSIVDDKFFKLSEMEAFLDEQDKKAMKNAPDNEDEETDDDDLSEDDETVQTNYKYKDFFDMPDDNTGGNAEDDSSEEIEEDESGSEETEEDESGSEEIESESEEVDQNVKLDAEELDTAEKKAVSTQEKSSFEKRQEKLQHQITDLEKKNLDVKSWQMTGEVFSSSRPENSLLQETVEFDYMTRQAPAITEETTKSIEELIIQRIKDKAWDDVERKARATDKMVEYSKRVVVDQEKSKMSLSEIYEQQFIKLSEKSDETVTKQDPKHAEVRASMNALFMKLDALANFHYTPKPMVHDVKIVSNLPALTVEEKLPSAVSDAALRAPEEVQAKSKREFVGETEKTKTDKLRARRLKKKLQHEKRLKREIKEKKAGKSETSGGVTKKASLVKEDNTMKKKKLGAVLNEKMKSANSKRKVHSA